MTTTTGEYRGADPDGLRLLARTLDEAADGVAASSRAVRAAAGTVCLDVRALTPLANVVWELRDAANAVRQSLATLQGMCLGGPPGAVTFEIPLAEEEDDGGGGWGHTVLDVAGFVPVVGAVPDGINAAWYAAEGDGVNAALSAGALVPFVGDGAAAARFVGKNADEGAGGLRSGDEVFTTADLVANELKGAPGLAEHVGQSPDELLARARSGGYDVVSSFHDAASAARGIDAALRANPAKVADVLEGRVKSEVFDATVLDLGIVMTSKGELLEANTVRVKLKRADRGGLVVTAFVESL